MQYQKIYVMLAFTILVSYNFLYSAVRCKSKQWDEKAIIKQSMDIWTHIDLVRAITIDTKQKEHFLDTIADLLLEIYAHSYNNKRESSTILQEVFEHIKENLLEVFGELQGESLHASCFILRKLMHQLKAPTNVQS